MTRSRSTAATPPARHPRSAAAHKQKDKAMDALATSQPVRELAHRSNHGLEVTLLWRPLDDSLSLLINDAYTDQCFRLPVPHDKALELFYHPLAYAPADAAADTV